MKEIPMHPALVRNLRIVQREAPEKLRSTKSIFDKMQQQLVDNARTHSLYDEKGDELATVLFTKVSTDDLAYKTPLREVASGRSISSSEKILELAGARDLSVGIMPGFALPQQGGPLDNERVRQAVDIMGHAITQGKNTTILLHGLVVGQGSRVSKEWGEQLSAEGFARHGILYADSFRNNTDIKRPDSLIVPYGESMGCINAKYTAQELTEQDAIVLYAQNPPGAFGQMPAWLKRTQVIMGYIGESGIKRIMKRVEKFTPKTIEEKPFFNAFYTYLEDRGVIREENSQQTKLKWQTAGIDFYNLLQQVPFSTEEVNLPTILDYGWKDPTSFTLERMKQWKRGERESIKGLISHQLSNFAHTPEYNPMRWVNELGS